MRGTVLLAVLLTACAPSLAAHREQTGVATAWVTFDAKGLRHSGADGLADRAAGRRLTIDDPARVASISKLVVALGVMRMVEADTLDLDADVSDQLGWRLRNPAFPDTPITLRLLLSHRSSLKDDVDYVVPLGRSLRDVLANPAAFDATHAPGTFFRYSNLGFPVIASVMERASGERFDRLMRRLVLDPLAIDGCYGWATCSDAAIARAVVFYEPDGRVVIDDLKGTRPTCPVAYMPGAACDLDGYVLGSNGALFSPQGGLRISARGLTAVGRLLLDDGRHAGRPFLTPDSIATLLAPVWRYDGANGASEGGFYCAYGLASQSLPVTTPGCDDDLFGDGRAVVGHAGDAYRLRSGLWIDRRRKVGIAYFATNNGVDPPKGRSAYRAVEERLAAHLRD